MKLNPPNAHRSQIKICEKRQTRNVQFRFMPNAFLILKPIQKSSKCVWVFRNTGANAFAKNQTRLAYEDKRDLYCNKIIMFCKTSKLYLLNLCHKSFECKSCSRLYPFIIYTLAIWDCVCGIVNDTGLLTWISLTVLFRTYFNTKFTRKGLQNIMRAYLAWTC